MNQAALQITEERTFTARLNDRTVTGLAVAGAWEGLTKYTRTNGDHLIVLDAEARVIAGTPSLVALLGAPTAPVALAEGEVYVGIVLDQNDKPLHHLVLLPGESEGSWAQSMKWAESIGGVLPSRQDQRLLYEKVKAEFAPRWYWSAEQHAACAGCAWFQYFYGGIQGGNLKSASLRARAVRRLPI